MSVSGWDRHQLRFRVDTFHNSVLVDFRCLFALPRVTRCMATGAKGTFVILILFAGASRERTKQWSAPPPLHMYLAK